MTQTSTLCSHRSISQSIEELWSMPCIISWAPALRARPPQDVGQSLLVVVLRRLPEPSTRKIAAQEPPSSAGHNDVPHADLARVSMGRDAGQGAYSPHFFRPLWTHARRHPRAPRGSLTPCASPLHGDRRGSAKPARGSRQTPSACVIAVDLLSWRTV